MSKKTKCYLPPEAREALDARMLSGPFRRDELIAMAVEMTGMHRVDAETAVYYRLQKARKAGLIQVSKAHRFIWMPVKVGGKQA